ncbi:MAG TPA: M50 family metallopeptidase, partial [Myxococcota bacterium]
GAAAGLRRGEFITAINGQPIAEEAGFRTAITSSEGKPIMMTVLNTSGEKPVSRDVEITPLAVEGGFRVGVSPQTRWPSAGFIGTLDAAVGTTVMTTIGTLNALKGLVMREPGVDVGGPVAIVAGMKDNIARGMRFYVHILATLSVSLGLFNLLPIPGLDGIKMLWLTIEGALRRNLNLKLQEVVNAVGMLLLLGLMAVLTVRDGVRLFG